MIHPAPKPRKKRKPKRQYSSIKPASFAKRKAAQKKLRESSKPVRKHARPKKEKDRIYGGTYADWIRAKPCCACGVVGFSQAAHTATGGTGRKADAATLVPLCGPHYVPPDFLYNGCHEQLHRMGALSWAFASLDLKAIAAKLRAEWLAFASPNSAVEVPTPPPSREN